MTRVGGNDRRVRTKTRNLLRTDIHEEASVKTGARLVHRLDAVGRGTLSAYTAARLRRRQP